MRLVGRPSIESHGIAEIGLRKSMGLRICLTRLGRIVIFPVSTAHEMPGCSHRSLVCVQWQPGDFNVRQGVKDLVPEFRPLAMVIKKIGMVILQ